MRFTSSQTSFKSGRLSPKLNNRVDTTQYRDGASQLQGCRPMLEGGVDRIKGYRFVRNEIMDGFDSTYATKTFSFVIDGKTIVAIIQENKSTNEVRLILERHPYSIGIIEWDNSFTDYELLVQAGSTQYAAELFDWAVLDRTLVITHYSGTMCPFVISFNADVDEATASLLYSSYSPSFSFNKNYGTGAVFPTYALAQTYPIFATAMTDIGATSGVLAISNFTTVSGVSYVDIKSTGNAEVIAILQKTSVLYLEGIGEKDFGDGFLRSVIGAAFYQRSSNITDGAKFIVWEPRVGPADPLLNVSCTTTDTWASAAWYEYNWPRTVTSHESRFIFGGTPSNPLTFFGSKTGTPWYFCHLKKPYSGSELYPYGAPWGPVVSTDPFVFTANSKEDSAITFVRSAQGLVIGTDRREYLATGGDTILSALSINCGSKTSQGSVPLKNASDGSAVYYISNGGKKLFKFKYNESNGSFVSQDLSVLFSDLLEEDYIVDIEWVPHTSSIMIATYNGHLYGIVDNAQTETTAFYDTLMGTIESDEFLTGVRDMCFVPSAVSVSDTDNYGDHLLLTVSGLGFAALDITAYEQGILSSGVREEITAANIHLYVDKAISMVYTTDTTTTWQGEVISHPAWENGIPVPLSVYPEGTEIIVAAWLPTLVDPDTLAYETITVGPEDDVTGYFMIDRSAYPSLDTSPLPFQVIIGVLPRPMQGATMPIEAGQQWGTSQMGIKNIDKIGARVYRSYSAEFSSGEGTWEEVIFATEEGKAQSTRKEFNFSSSPKYDQIVYFRNTKAEPCTIIGLNMRGVSNDG